MAEHTNIPLFVYDLGLTNVQAIHLEKHYAKVVIKFTGLTNHNTT
jgi:hypothetical protein